MLHSSALSTCLLHSLASQPPQPPSLAPQPCSTDPSAPLHSPPSQPPSLASQAPSLAPPPCMLDLTATLPVCLRSLTIKLSKCTVSSPLYHAFWQHEPLSQAAASRAGLEGQLQPCVPCTPRGFVFHAPPGSLFPCTPREFVSHAPPGTLALALA